MNRMKLGEYREHFRSEMEVLEESLVSEGARYLTPEIEAELAAKGYTREDLLTRTVTYFATKRQ